MREIMKFKEENHLEVFIETLAKNDDIRKVLFIELVKCFYQNQEYFLLRFMLKK